MEYSEGLLKVNDVDTLKGNVKFYFSRFDTPDKNGRLMGKTAFNRTIKNNKDMIYHLLNHNPESIIGKPIEFGTDKNGMWVVSKMSKNDIGQRSLKLYQEGVYKYHSFGFYIVNSQMEKDIEIVNEAKIVEVSTVLYPAHDGETTIDMNKMDDLLRNNKLSNEILIKLDQLIARLPVENQHQTSQEINNFESLEDFIKKY